MTARWEQEADAPVAGSREGGPSLSGRPAAPATWSATGLVPWSPPTPTSTPSRALVLAGGGATGIAWEAGVLAGLRDEGVDVRDADLIVGTSAGSAVAAQLRVGTDEADAYGDIRAGRPLGALGRLGPRDGARFLRAQLGADRAAARSVVGRAALRARTASEDDWVDTVAGTLRGRGWPRARLAITAVDAETGAAVVFDNDSGVALDRAVAASCAVPGVFPPVTVGARRYVDGGLRSVANVDLAAGHERVLVLSPIPLAVRRRDRPGPQVRDLPGVRRSLVLVPDRAAAAAMGLRPLDMRRGARTEQAGREQGCREADRARRVWLA